MAFLPLLAVGLQGCDEEELTRAFHLDKGTYHGEPDRPLSAQEVDELRARVRTGARM